MAFTFTTSTNSSLSGTTNFLLTKDGSTNYQGRGISYPFTIDQGMQGKVLQGTFDYRIDSGTYTSGDLTVWIYDVTNGTLIQPAPTSIYNHSLPSEPFFFEFQTSSNSTSYRLIIHQSTVTTNDYTIRFDNFNISRQAKLYGSPITDPVDYTPTYAGLGTVTTTQFQWSKRGAMMRVQGKITLGTTTGATASFTLPNGAIPNVSSVRHVGSAVFGGTTAAPMKAALLASPSSNLITFGIINASLTGAAGSSIGSSGDVYSIDLEVPIVGWQSSTIMSSDAATNVIGFRTTGVPTGTLSGTWNQVTYPAAVSDSNGAYSAGVYTILVPGYYDLSASFTISAASITSGQYVGIQLQKNGTGVATNVVRSIGTGAAIPSPVSITSVYCNVGDTIRVASHTNYSSASFSAQLDNTEHFFSVHRVSGPAQIAASESILVSAKNSSGQSISNNTVTDITNWTLVKDSSGSFNASTGVFTAPSPGNYEIILQVGWTTSATGTRVGRIKYQGSDVSYTEAPASASIPPTNFVLWSGPMLTGETLKPAVFQNSGGSVNLSSDSNTTKLSIKRTGNY